MLAEEMKVGDFEQIKTWWETIRNRYVRLHCESDKSGSAPLDESLMTPKDLFAWRQCNFLHRHIRHQQQQRPTKKALRHALEPPPPQRDLLVDADDLARVVVPAAGDPLGEG